MKEFKQFVKTEQSKKRADTDAEKAGMKLPDGAEKIMDGIKSEDVDFVKNIAEKYGGKKDMLMNDIVKLAAKSKKEGKLDDEQLEGFEKRLEPMLNDKQKKMLKDIMGKIKD